MRNGLTAPEIFADQTDSFETKPRQTPIAKSDERTYTVVTANVCLMPEFLSKLNNVSNTVKRAERMARLLCGRVENPDSHCSKNEDLTRSSFLSHSREEFAQDEGQLNRCCQLELIKGQYEL